MSNVLKKARIKVGVLLSLLVSVFVIHELVSKVDNNLVINGGVSFGQQFPFLLVITGVFCLICAILYIQQGSWGLMLITIGGLINFSDRLRLGHVRDYWNLFGSGIYNNINDWIIGVGVILFLIENIWKKSK